MPIALPLAASSNASPLVSHLKHLFVLRKKGWKEERGTNGVQPTAAALTDWGQQMSTTMALAAAGPFDPSQLIEVTLDGWGGWAPMTALEAVLEADWTDRFPPSRLPCRDPIDWPNDPSAFNAHLLAQVGGCIDGEWVAAWFTAAGCDPWRVPMEALEAWWATRCGQGRAMPPVPISAVERAMFKGHVGLLKRFLALPGAPSDLQAWADGLSWRLWATLLASPHALPTLSWLLRQGVRLRQDQTLSQMVRAKRPAVEALVLANACTVSPQLAQKLNRRWRSEWEEDMPATATRNQVAHTYAAALANEPGAKTVGMALTRVLRQGWGEPCPIDKPAPGTWDDHYRLPGGPLAGDWNMLGVWTLGQLKARLAATKWARPEAEATEYAAACARPWRPGCPWAGLVWLREGLVPRSQSPSAVAARATVCTILRPTVRAAVKFSAALARSATGRRDRPLAGWLMRRWARGVAETPALAAALGNHERAELLAGLVDGVSEVLPDEQEGPAQVDSQTLAKLLVPEADRLDPLRRPPGHARRAAQWANWATEPIENMLTSVTRSPWLDDPAARGWYEQRFMEAGRYELVSPGGWLSYWDHHGEAERLDRVWPAPAPAVRARL